jgi:hypothetical protein
LKTEVALKQCDQIATLVSHIYIGIFLDVIIGKNVDVCNQRCTFLGSLGHATTNRIVAIYCGTDPIFIKSSQNSSQANKNAKISA